MSRPHVGPHMQAALDALRTRTGRPIGYRTKPELSAPTDRYAILYGIGETRDGTLAADEVATFTLQLTCVAPDGVGVDRMSREVDDALLGAPVTVAGRSVRMAFLDGGVDGRDQDTAGRQLLYTTPRYRMWSAPA